MGRDTSTFTPILVPRKDTAGKLGSFTNLKQFVAITIYNSVSRSNSSNVFVLISIYVRSAMYAMYGRALAYDWHPLLRIMALKF